MVAGRNTTSVGTRDFKIRKLSNGGKTLRSTDNNEKYRRSFLIFFMYFKPQLRVVFVLYDI